MFGQVAPGGTGTQDPDDGVEEASVVACAVSGGSGASGQQGFECEPGALGDGVAFHGGGRRVNLGIGIRAANSTIVHTL